MRERMREKMREQMREKIEDSRTFISVEMFGILSVNCSKIDAGSSRESHIWSTSEWKMSEWNKRSAN